MQIEITELEPCKLLVHYEANFLEIADKRAEVQNTFKKAPVPGFRDGKAPLDAVKIHYHKQIEESVKRALAEDAYHNTLFEKKLRVHGAPRFTNLLMDSGKFTCEFELFTKPDFVLPTLADMEVPKPHEDVSVVELTEKMMQELRVRLGDVEPYTEADFIQDGDNVILDYEGSVDGKPVDGLTAQGEMLTIGGSLMPGFDTNLLGMVLGEEREFDFVAPEGGLPSLSGKPIHFKVTLVMGSKTVPCPLNDEMAKKLNKKDFAEVKEFVSQAAFARSASMSRAKMREVVSKKLVAETKIDVPNWMALSEAQYLAQQSQLDWNVMADQDKEKLLEMGTDNVKLSLILDKVREDTPEAQLTDQEVFQMIKENLSKTKSGANLDEVIQQMNQTGYLQILFSRIKDEHTMDYVVKSVKVIE